MSVKKIKSVGIIVKPSHAEALETARELSVWLGERQISAKQKDFENVGLAVVLGGDGTMISAARQLQNLDVPVLGINYGSLGYITEFRIEELYDALDMVLSRTCTAAGSNRKTGFSTMSSSIRRRSPGSLISKHGSTDCTSTNFAPTD
jgi:NAD+ kinase